MTGTARKDIIIIGGGIAGLLTLSRLRNAGFDAILLEAGKLGQGQTLASQGMIHGGVKYTLGGKETGASQSIADMPAYWKACTEGSGDIDLSNTRLLSSQYYMWPRQSVRSRLTAFLGSKALRGKVKPLDEADYPDFFRSHIKGPLYQLTDIVLDVPSLLTDLSNQNQAHIGGIRAETLQAELNPEGGINTLTCTCIDGSQHTFSADRFITTSGEGTEQLLQQLGISPVPMQRRPLQMVMVRHRNPHPIFVHCVSDNLTATPALTITSHPAPAGDQVWYLGGELAESGINLAKETQINRAQALLEELFPWCDFSEASWDTLDVNRAEPQQADGLRPDSAFVHHQNNLMICWPTKLTLAPALANRILDELNTAQLKPCAEDSALTLPFPGIAATPWSHL